MTARGRDFRASAVDRLLHDAVTAGHVPGVVAALADRDSTIYEGAFGAAGIDGRPLRTDTVFRIASMTKLVTAVGVMLLQEDGVAALDDPLHQHLPGFRQPEVLVDFNPADGAYTTRPATTAITLRQLLAHTSGYGYWYLSKALRAVCGENASPFEAPFLLHEPGERFTYGIGTDVAGLLFEPVTGQPLEMFFQQRIFDPLGMHSTGYALPGADRLAPLHVRRNGGFGPHPLQAQASPPRGGGGLHSTADDYLRLLRLFLADGRHGGGRLLEPESLEAIARNQIGELTAAWQHSVAPQRTRDFAILDGTQKFGLSVAVETRTREGGRAAGSFGWGGIFNSFFWVDPTAGLAAVLLMQMSPFCDAGCIRLYREFEQAVYAAL